MLKERLSRGDVNMATESATETDTDAQSIVTFSIPDRTAKVSQNIAEPAFELNFLFFLLVISKY